MHPPRSLRRGTQQYLRTSVTHWLCGHITFPPPLDVVHINVVDATIPGKGCMCRVYNKLRSVHPRLRAIRHRFPVDAVHDLCQQAIRKLDTSPRQFGLEIEKLDPAAPPLHRGSGKWETVRVRPIVPQWTDVVPDFSTSAVFTTAELYFLQRCGNPLPFVSLASPVFSHNLPSPHLSSDESLKELGLRVLKGVVDKEEASQWYAIVRGSLEPTRGQRVEVCDFIFNEDSREA